MEAMAAILKNKMAAAIWKLIITPSSMVWFSSNLGPVKRFQASVLMFLSSVTTSGHFEKNNRYNAINILYWYIVVAIGN